ncbi:alpha/beta hydrolase fold domain-containing protein [Streptomyces sp. NPDC002143]
MTKQPQTATQPEWTPTRFLPPGEGVHRAGGTRHYSEIGYAILGGYRPLRLDLWVPAGVGPHPVVVFVHGGAWILGDRHTMVPVQDTAAVVTRFLDAGVAVASVDYRLAREAVFPAQLHDVKSAVRYLRRHANQLDLASDRIAVWGESAGAHLAALLALTSDRPELEGEMGVTGLSSAVVAAVGWYGIYDLAAMPELVPPKDMPFPPDLAEEAVEVLLGAPATEERARPASPVTYVTADAPPFLLVHGTQDHLVPFEQSRLLQSALLTAGAEVDLVPVEGADHGFFGAPEVPAVLEQSTAFLIKHLGN